MKIGKLWILIALLLLVSTATALAKPVITSDKNYFDIKTGRYVLEGNVRIETGSRTISAGKAVVKLTSQEVWGSEGVTVQQDDLLFKGDSVYVSGSTSTATIQGGVDLEANDHFIRSNQVSYNWKTKLATFSGHVTFSEAGKTTDYNTLTYDMKTNSIIRTEP